MLSATFSPWLFRSALASRRNFSRRGDTLRASNWYPDGTRHYISDAHLVHGLATAGHDATGRPRGPVAREWPTMRRPARHALASLWPLSPTGCTGDGCRGAHLAESLHAPRHSGGARVAGRRLPDLVPTTRLHRARLGPRAWRKNSLPSIGCIERWPAICRRVAFSRTGRAYTWRSGGCRAGPATGLARSSHGLSNWLLRLPSGFSRDALAWRSRA